MNPDEQQRQAAIRQMLADQAAAAQAQAQAQAVAQSQATPTPTQMQPMAAAQPPPPQGTVPAAATASAAHHQVAASTGISQNDLANYLSRATMVSYQATSAPSQVPLRGLADYPPSATNSVTSGLPPQILTGLTSVPSTAASATTGALPIDPAALQQQQSLVQSAQLLAGVNPGLAAAAMAQALAMNGTAPPAAQVQAPPQQVNNQSVGLSPAVHQAVATQLHQHWHNATNAAAQGSPTLSSTPPNQDATISASTSAQISAPMLPISAANTVPYPAAPSANNSQLAQNSNKVKRESGPSLQSTQLGHVPTASSSLGRNQGQLMAGQPPAIGHVPIQAMQKWSLEGLESHVKELQAANQPVPQAVALLLADARRKADKREAKRLANRRSAATSRNRKKMLIEEMTRDNARLRRHALILSYLPDPVVSISLEGDITFCNMQLERVLKHPIEDLIGANIEDIMVPSSRKIVRRLIRDLVIAEQRALGNGEEGGDLVTDNSKARAPNEVSEENLTSSEPTTRPPMVEVSVKSSKNKPPNDSGEDASSSSNPSGKSKTSSLTQQESSVTGDPSSNDDQPPSKKARISGESPDRMKANQNLNKNVEECELNMTNKGAKELKSSHKDDVMGASVTANNADAKLSSLMKPTDNAADVPTDNTESSNLKEKDSSSAESSRIKDKKRNAAPSSEDSGYRQSNESPEESSFGSSCISDAPDKRHRPLAPSITVRLVRDDLTTIWCEITSSIRTRPPNDEDEKANIFAPVATSVTASGNSGKPSKPSANHEGSESVGSSEGTEIEEKEVLLCFRPIREGDVVSSEFRFVKKHVASSSDDQLKTDSKDGSAKDSHDHDGAEPEPAKVPFKKRRKFGAETELSQTRLGVEEESQQGEQSAAESMINLRQSSS